MRVLHLRSSRVFAGPEKQIVTLIPHLVELGWQPEVAVLHRGPGSHPLLKICQGQNIAARAIRDQGPLPFGAAYSLRKELKSQGVDVVHSHDYKANAVAALAGVGQAWPCVATVHLHTRSDSRLRLYHRLDRFVLRRFSHVILVASSLAGSLPSYIGNAPTTAVVVNGVDLPGPGRGESRNDIRRELGLGPEHAVVLAVGRLAWQKGFDLLAAATSRLLQKVPSLVVLIAGEGPEKKRLERQIGESGLDGGLRLLGHRDDVPLLLEAADLVVLPSRFEGTPYVLLEALAHGVPVVACAVGGIPEVLDEGFPGSLVPPGDPEALSAAIQRLLEDPDLRSRLSRTGRSVVAERYSAHEMARQTALVYERARA